MSEIDTRAWEEWFWGSGARATHRHEMTFPPPPLYTVSVTRYLNPWHRSCRTRGERARRVMDILHWELRRLIRRPLPDKETITIPDCRIESMEIDFDKEWE